MLMQLIKPSWGNKAYDNRNCLLTQIGRAQGRLSPIRLDCGKCQRLADIPYGRGLLQGLWVRRDALLPMYLHPLASGPTASGTLMGHTTTLSQLQLPIWWTTWIGSSWVTVLPWRASGVPVWCGWSWPWKIRKLFQESGDWNPRKKKNHVFQLHRSVGYLQIFLNSQKHFPILRT